jgi:hypothetical protein
MSLEVRTAGAAVEEWLRGEHVYQVDKFDEAYADDVEIRTRFIFDYELANKWQRAAMFRRGGGMHQSNQQIFKVTAAARALNFCDAELRGEDRRTASEHSFTALHDLFRSLERIDVPPEINLYDPRFETVYEGVKRDELLFRAARLSVAAVLETYRLDGELLLPKPGAPSGGLEDGLRLMDPFAPGFTQP